MKININGMPVLIDVTHHDSNEEPEESCTNKMVSFLVDGRVHQFLNVDSQKSADLMSARLSLQSNIAPKEILCVITKFRESYFIDWPLIKRHAA